MQAQLEDPEADRWTAAMKMLQDKLGVPKNKQELFDLREALYYVIEKGPRQSDLTEERVGPGSGTLEGRSRSQGI